MTKEMPDNLQNLRKHLNNRKETVREQALEAARELPAEVLLQLVDQEANHARKGIVAQERVSGTCCLWILVCVVTVIAQFAYQTAFPLWDALLFAWLPVSIMVTNKFAVSSQTTIMLSRAIVTQTDARFVAPALLFYLDLDSRTDPELNKDMRAALLRLLPTLTPADMQTWTSQHKAALCSRRQGGNRFDLWHDLEMLRCVLVTLEQAGDVFFLPAIRHLANMNVEQITRQIAPHLLADDRKDVVQAIRESVTIDTGKHGVLDPENTAVMQDIRYKEWCRERAEELQQAAVGCQFAIEQRMEEQRQNETLLRAAAITNTPDTTILLRAAQAEATETPLEQLLRPK